MRRLVGVNMKSGGAIVRRADMQIVAGAVIMNALKADEVVAAARSANVDFDAQDDACGVGAAGAPAAAETAAPENVQPVPEAPPPSPGIAQWLQENMLLAALLVLGVVAALFGIVTLTRRNEGAQPAPAAPLPAAPAEAGPASGS